MFLSVIKGYVGLKLGEANFVRELTWQIVEAVFPRNVSNWLGAILAEHLN
jgi:hypothetical protein